MKKNSKFRDTFIDNVLIKIVLRPFSWLYGVATGIRNLLYDLGLKKSQTTAQFSIVVGNITVGGTGKTPMVEYLIRKLKTNHQVVTLSRGYGRKTRGFRVASSDSTAADVGDEPLQYYKKFGKDCQIAVCENRIKGSEALNTLFPDHKVLLLDDAFQHRALRPDLAILLSDYNRPFYLDEPFPGGRLRETRRGAQRADAVVVTKCPENLDRYERAEILHSIQKYTTPATPCFFSRVIYGALVNFENTEISAQTVTVVSGIAQPGPLVAYVGSKYNMVDVKIFPDHYNYTLSDVQELVRNTTQDQKILTTEKDMVKLLPLAQQAGVLAKFAYIPIQIDFGEDTAGFDEWLSQNLKGLTRLTKGPKRI